MRLDEGAYLVLQSATGAFTCNEPPLPRRWTNTNRPYVALLMLVQQEIQRLLLSHPRTDGSIEVSDIEELPETSILEIRHDSREYGYFRKDKAVWTKVGAAQDPFLVEVFTHGGSPIIMNMVVDMTV